MLGTSHAWLTSLFGQKTQQTRVLYCKLSAFKKFTKKFDSKVIFNRQYFHRKTKLES